MDFDFHPNALTKDIADEPEILANNEERHSLGIRDGRLWIGGCDCTTALHDVDTARRMVAMLNRWIDALERS